MALIEKFLKKTELVSAVIYAFWPSQIFYNSLVLTEPFFTLGILFLIAFYLYTIKRIKNTIWKIPPIFIHRDYGRLFKVYTPCNYYSYLKLFNPLPPAGTQI